MSPMSQSPPSGNPADREDPQPQLSGGLQGAHHHPPPDLVMRCATIPEVIPNELIVAEVHSVPCLQREHLPPEQLPGQDWSAG